MTDEQEQEDAQRNELTVPSHRFTVTLGHPERPGPGWGTSYTLTCEGDPAMSVCHWWRDEEGDPSSYRQHEECSVLDWFHNDQTQFVEEGYAGPLHDGMTSGLVDIHSWGEDGFEWSYIEPGPPATIPSDASEDFDPEMAR